MSLNKCGYCENSGHNIRGCQNSGIELLLQRFDLIQTTMELDLLTTYKSVELSLIMIHKYNAPNVSFSKQEKMGFIIENWLQEHTQEPAIVVPLPLVTPAMSRILQIANEFQDALLNSYTLIQHQGWSRHQFMRIYRRTLRRVNSHPEVNFNPTVKNIIIAQLRRFTKDYLEMMETMIQHVVQPLVVQEEQTPMQIIDIRKNQTSSEEKMECIICYEDFPKNNLALLNCQHEMCCNCLFQMAKKRGKTGLICPYCRTVVCQVFIHDKTSRKGLIHNLKTIIQY